MLCKMCCVHIIVRNIVFTMCHVWCVIYMYCVRVLYAICCVHYVVYSLLYAMSCVQYVVYNVSFAICCALPDLQFQLVNCFACHNLTSHLSPPPLTNHPVVKSPTEIIIIEGVNPAHFYCTPTVGHKG